MIGAVVGEDGGEGGEAASTLVAAAEGPGLLPEDAALHIAEAPLDEKSTPTFHLAVVDDGLMAEAGREPDLSLALYHDHPHVEDAILHRQDPRLHLGHALHHGGAEGQMRIRADHKLLVNLAHNLQVDQMRQAHVQLEVDDEDRRAHRLQAAVEAHTVIGTGEDVIPPTPLLSRDLGRVIEDVEMVEERLGDGDPHPPNPPSEEVDLLISSGAGLVTMIGG